MLCPMWVDQRLIAVGDGEVVIQSMEDNPLLLEMNSDSTHCVDAMVIRACVQYLVDISDLILFHCGLPTAMCVDGKYWE